MLDMKRRQFVSLLGGAAVALPHAARAQQTNRRVAVLMGGHETDPLGQARLNAFLQGFQLLGWTEGHNLQTVVRWSGDSMERTREIATEFMAFKPDVILAHGSPVVAVLKEVTSTIPIVFVTVNEPVVQGFIASMARPGGNITGFTLVEFSVVGKLVEVFKAMVPTLSRVGLMFNPGDLFFLRHLFGQVPC